MAQTDQSASQSVAELEAQLEEWRALAVETSVQRDQAVAALEEVAAKVGAPKPGLQPPAIPVAAPPAPPPPPRPASMSAFLQLPPHEKARAREHFGAKLEEELDAEFHRNLTIANARGAGRTSYAVAQVGPPDSAAAFDARQWDPPSVTAENFRKKMTADYERGQALLASLPDGDPRKSALISLNSGIGSGRPPVRPVAPVRPVVHGSGPSGGGKSRQLGATRK